MMNNIKYLNIQTELGENEFQILVLKDEEIGLITTKNARNYLILDSLDYWYDAIQEQFPKKIKCVCKNEWFTLQFHYLTRDNSNDFQLIEIYATCTKCSKKSKKLSVNINYSPTENLYNQPISYCHQPNIKYKSVEITSYWTDNDLIAFLSYMHDEFKLHTYLWFYNQDNKRSFEKVDLKQTLELVQNHYLTILFSNNELEVSKITSKDDNGVYIDDSIWRKNEIISLSSPIQMTGYGLLYYINFCNQFIDSGVVVDKSATFEHITQKLIKWLELQFVSTRGKNCFDGQTAYNQFITNFKK